VKTKSGFGNKNLRCFFKDSSRVTKGPFITEPVSNTPSPFKIEREKNFPQETLGRAPCFVWTSEAKRAWFPALLKERG